MNPLNAREWLEGIVRTGSQRSGFAQDALQELDEATARDDEDVPRLAMLDEVVDHLENAPGVDVVLQAEWVGEQFDVWGDQTGLCDWEPIAAALTHRLDQYSDILGLLQDAGVVERGTVPEDLVGLLAMFVHG